MSVKSVNRDDVGKFHTYMGKRYPKAPWWRNSSVAGGILPIRKKMISNKIVSIRLARFQGLSRNVGIRRQRVVAKVPCMKRLSLPR